MPDVRHLDRNTLLAMLVGEDLAASVADVPTRQLFGLDSNAVARETEAQYLAGPVFDAARELLARALAEQMQSRELLSTPAVVREFLRLRLAGLAHEVFVVLLLDAQNRLIDAVEMFRGTLTQTSVYPREIVKLALARNAAGVVFAHNHPSGVAEPSRADECLTQTLKQALALVDVRVLDHFIVAGLEPPLSFAERGLL